jgi:hypothetical protein
MAQNFIEMNDLEVKRLTCAGDSDRDGYGSCVIRTIDGEMISLKCPTDFFAVNMFGATSCKEDVRVYQLSR